MSASIQSITDLPIDLLCYGIGDWVKKYRRYQQKYNDTRDQFEGVINNTRKKVIDTLYKHIEMTEPQEMTYDISRLLHRFPPEALENPIVKDHLVSMLEGHQWHRLLRQELMVAGREHLPAKQRWHPTSMCASNKSITWFPRYWNDHDKYNGCITIINGIGIKISPNNKLYKGMLFSCHQCHCKVEYFYIENGEKYSTIKKKNGTTLTNIVWHPTMSRLTVEKLKKILKENGVKFKSNMKKADLIKLVLSIE